MGKNSRISIKGFTLVEMVVVIAILGLLFSLLISIFNPLHQFTKANDSKRQEDLRSIHAALDEYFNDTGCFPKSVPFNSSFVNPNYTGGNGSAMYMKLVPQDPDCATNPTHCYYYQTDQSVSCPQWNVLYSGLRAGHYDTQSNTLCPLEVLNSDKANNPQGCLPPNYTTNGYNYCLTSGQVDCSAIVSGVSAPAPTQALGCQKIYKCTSVSVQNPKGVCNIVGADKNGNGLGDYCGAPGCVNNVCCLNSCTQ